MQICFAFVQIRRACGEARQRNGHLSSHDLISASKYWLTKGRNGQQTQTGFQMIIVFSHTLLKRFDITILKVQ